MILLAPWSLCSVACVFLSQYSVQICAVSTGYVHVRASNPKPLQIVQPCSPSWNPLAWHKVGAPGSSEDFRRTIFKAVPLRSSSLTVVFYVCSPGHSNFATGAELLPEPLSCCISSRGESEGGSQCESLRWPWTTWAKFSGACAAAARGPGGKHVLLMECSGAVLSFLSRRKGGGLGGGRGPAPSLPFCMRRPLRVSAKVSQARPRPSCTSAPTRCPQFVCSGKTALA